MAEDRGAVSWRRSSYSNRDNDPNCCEVAVCPGVVLVRDSTRTDDPMLTFTRSAWLLALALFSDLGRYQARR
ncbi:DUF397 domain-containing protein [Streptomyces spectabilis]|uniref:DUF397 domain-containing protein n=1 Tax=Streptomyces spectabilis TaxID=68270 RepID=A0A5P2X6W3_STRST|nr:DUF397 domain-containing protein [Streptomyces spectabilis]MCI3903545.1 DUF397 domain-containing protein [Streptomyces spectabilis]QEV60743.1 DUF397 domain-containing protein [Streptomyces spectabilis]GGV48244.1 hypothetical protein GCM10010245_75910 [Streptomyces spectabilis]